MIKYMFVEGLRTHWLYSVQYAYHYYLSFLETVVGSYSCAIPSTPTPFLSRL